MITIKSPREIETMAAAGRIVAETLALVARQVRPGISTEQLDHAAEDFIRSHPGARPSFKGLYDFPATLCTSINQEVVHGIPSSRRVLQEGDLLSVDVGVWLDGLHADSAATFPVGKVSPQAERLLAVTQEALAAGVAQARAGNHVGDIGHAVQGVAESAGYSVVRELVGHGVTGLVVDPGDPRAIATATLRLLGDRELRDAMGAAGRRRAAEHFGLERLADLHLRAYELARAHRRGGSTTRSS